MIPIYSVSSLTVISMTDTYYDDRPVKRRTLALVALLALCMVSLTSVAYAYTTTVNIEDNPIADHYYTIDYTDNAGAPLMVPLAMTPANDEIVITTVVGHTVSGNAYTEKTVTASIDANTFTRTFYVKFNADEGAEDKAFTISVVATPDSVLGKFVSMDPAVTYEVGGHVVEPNAIHKGNLVKVTLTMNVTAVENINTLELSTQVPATITAETDLVALLDDVRDELATHTFDVRVTVEPTTTTPTPTP